MRPPAAAPVLEGTPQWILWCALATPGITVPGHLARSVSNAVPMKLPATSAREGALRIPRFATVLPGFTGPEHRAWPAAFAPSTPLLQQAVRPRQTPSARAIQATLATAPPVAHARRVPPASILRPNAAHPTTPASSAPRAVAVRVSTFRRRALALRSENALRARSAAPTPRRRVSATGPPQRTSSACARRVTFGQETGAVPVASSVIRARTLSQSARLPLTSSAKPVKNVV
jgi:hypothetical protein